MFTFEQAKAFMDVELHAEQQLAEAKREEAEQKLVVARCQFEFERQETFASSNAFQLDKIDGKNEKHRAIQLEAILQDDKEVRQARDKLVEAQSRLLICQHMTALAEATLHYRQHLSLVAAGLVE